MLSHDYEIIKREREIEYIFIYIYIYIIYISRGHMLFVLLEGLNILC